ncbi:hypothetical protein PPO43_12720 [Saprospira sp. CCB-QB6]|uniref:hypothetical protein n=1 Tax=Saprospira sp. CCB-QB6 TaxID=3023936 RepID=UPI002349A94C|nr:hypothetical protein [Saprospira sp. CCB-QB6]WCL80835.1 hypothetical protein PPO43_12720 [Saprospira sp. CCB-QB6]
MNKVFHPFLFLLFSILLFSCNNEAPKAENNEDPKAVNAQDSSQKEEAAKAAEKTLLGKWFVVDMNNEKVEKGSLVIEFNVDGEVSMLNKDGKSSATYEFVKEENLIKVTNSDGAPETWLIDQWEENKLSLITKSLEGEESPVILER